MKLKTDLDIHYHSKQYNLPIKIDETFAWWIGIFYGDGSVYSPRNGGPNRKIEITCTEDEPEILEKVVQTTNKLFGYDCKIQRDKRSKAIHATIHSRQIVAFLELNGLCKEKSGDIQVPPRILRAPKNIHNAFISGYWDADGTTAIKKGTIDSFRAKSVSFKFLGQIQGMLHNQKIDCYRHDADGYSHYSEYHGYDITHSATRTLIVRSNSIQMFCDIMTESIKVQQVQEKILTEELRIPNFRIKNRFLNDNSKTV